MINSHPAIAYVATVIEHSIGVLADAELSSLQRATLNYQNAKALLAQTNSIHALKRFRGAALKRCASCRRELMDNILISEMKL